MVEPDDTHLYKVVPGKDLLTLETCTPYGINTQRLVITAKRGRIPQDVPKLSGNDDAVLRAAFVAAAVLLVGLAMVMTHRYPTIAPPPWHSAEAFGSVRRLYRRGMSRRGSPHRGKP